ncbi:MAG: hypothetical protein ABI808_16130 [Pseudonocardiales bacterium]
MNTTQQSAHQDSSTATTVRSHRVRLLGLRGRLASSSAVIVAAATALALAASPAQAVNNNAPNVTWNNGTLGATEATNVACDPATRSMLVSASASQMQSIGFAGPVDGPYAGGQYLSYRVWARDVNSPNFTLMYNWSQYRLINGRITNSVGFIYQPVLLGQVWINGAAGHNYQVMVDYAWYTGTDMTWRDWNPLYTQVYRAGYSSYVFNGSRCTF